MKREGEGMTAEGERRGGMGKARNSREWESEGRNRDGKEDRSPRNRRNA